jgi:alkylation response protein AidB-like acyl-CoA dehydrogenase
MLDGLVPWVTAGDQADYIITGGTLDDGQQILAAVARRASGVEVLPAQRLLALNASQTGAVRLHQVQVPARHLVAGPTPQVMKQGGGAGSLSTSALAAGVAQAAIDLLKSEAKSRPDLQDIVDSLSLDSESLEAELLTSAAAPANELPDCLSPDALRKRANTLVLHATQAALAASKGAGFVAGHPAERLCREALFFLVWSCPQPVLNATLRELVNIA